MPLYPLGRELNYRDTENTEGFAKYPLYFFLCDLCVCYVAPVVK